MIPRKGKQVLGKRLYGRDRFGEGHGKTSKQGMIEKQWVRNGMPRGPGAVSAPSLLGQSRVARWAARLDVIVCNAKSRTALSRTAFLGGQAVPVRRLRQAGTATSAGAWDQSLFSGTQPGPPVDRFARPVTGPCLLPHCDASRARPSSGADLRQGYSRGWDYCQEQSENTPHDCRIIVTILYCYLYLR